MFGIFCCARGRTAAKKIGHPSKIKWVQIDLGDDAKDANYYIDHDERVRVMMARQ